MTGTLFLVVSTFLATSIEVIEVTAILLGVGATRGWRWTLVGAGVGLAVLAAVIVALGAALTNIPIAVLRVFIGGLLLIFGMQWLVKGVRRVGTADDLLSPGEQESVDTGGDDRPNGGFDPTAFVLALKGVVLEGLEVSFIVVTFGAAQNQIPLAALAALAAIVVIGAAAVLAHSRVESIPKPWLRYVVGILLTTFGTFWSLEGIGVAWPGGDLAVLGILAVYILASLVYIWLIRDRRFPDVAPQAGS